jgi:single-strand DNA-binding protein
MTMESVNKVFLVGHLGQDPELRHTNNGKTVTTLRLATSHRGTDGNDRTEWHRVVLWGKQAEHAVENLKKGDRVAAEGRLRTSRWTDTKGEKRYRTEIDGRIIFPRGNNTSRSESVASSLAEADTFVQECKPSAGQAPIQFLGREETEAAEHREFRAAVSRFESGGDAPPCSECGDFTIRNGSCHVCLNCGTTTGCS